MFKRLERGWRYGYFTREKQRIFLEDLSVLIDDGVPIHQAVATIWKISSGILKRVASKIARSIAQGKQLADGMQGWFARPLIEMIRAGEVGGTLTKTLKFATKSVRQQQEVLKQFIEALLFPLIVLAVALGFLISVDQLVLKNFLVIKPLLEWPCVSKFIYQLGFIVEGWLWLVLLFLFILIYGSVQILQKMTGQLRSRLDKLFFIELHHEMIAARFMEMLGLLLSNGVVLKEALGIMHRDSSPYLSSHLLQMELALSSGQKSIAEVLDTQLIGAGDRVRLQVIASRRGFEYALMSLGWRAKQRVNRKIVRIGKLIGGFILILGSLLVMMVVLGVYSIDNSMIL